MNSSSDSDRSDRSLSPIDPNEDGFHFLKRKAAHLAEILPGKLYFATVQKVEHLKLIKTEYSTVYNKITKKQYECLVFDDNYDYLPFNKDFGPFNLAMLYMYCKSMDYYVRNKDVIIHCTCLDRKTRVNQAFLIGAYSIIYHKQTPKSLRDRWLDIRPERSSSRLNIFEPYVHAGFGVCRYQLQLEDCLAGVYRALENKILDFKTFNCTEYRKHERVENGDFNWIVPKQFIAFCDPETYSENLGVPVSFFVKYFRKKNVRLVVRLNLSTYEASQFTEAGIAHKDLVYPDGSIPSESIVRQFLTLAEETINKGSAVAVHCKAGLGRTGTLIACYIMKHYRFTAQEAIAWIRICRPGSVIGYQQRWLEKKQNWLWRLGDQYYGRTATQRKSINNKTATTTTVSEAAKRTPNRLIAEFDDDPELDEDLKSLMEDINNLGAKLGGHSDTLLDDDKLSDKSDSFTQGDFLNEIKLHRKKIDHHSNDDDDDDGTPANRDDSISGTNITVVKRIPVLRPRTSSKSSNTDVNNNLSQRTDVNTPKLSQLKLCGKKITKYSSPIRILPH